MLGLDQDRFGILCTKEKDRDPVFVTIEPSFNLIGPSVLTGLIKQNCRKSDLNAQLDLAGFIQSKLILSDLS